MKKILIIANPYSGRKKGEKILKNIINVFSNTPYDIINTTTSNVIEGNHDPTIINDGELSEIFPIRFSDDNEFQELRSFSQGSIRKFPKFTNKGKFYAKIKCK